MQGSVSQNGDLGPISLILFYLSLTVYCATFRTLKSHECVLMRWFYGLQLLQSNDIQVLQTHMLEGQTSS